MKDFARAVKKIGYAQCVIKRPVAKNLRKESKQFVWTAISKISVNGVIAKLKIKSKFEMKLFIVKNVKLNIFALNATIT